MTNTTKRVLIGWLNLTPTERADFAKEANEYLKMSREDQQKFERQLQAQDAKVKMAIGPLSTPCPCCGK